MVRIFVLDLNGDNVWEIFVLDFIGFYIELKWLRDGKWIVYINFFGEGVWIMVVDVDG